jgi:hypothetical protein
VSLSILIKVAGKRWPAQECYQQGKGQADLDQHKLRLWHSFHRHTVLAMYALALLAVATARPAPPEADPVQSDAPASSTGSQPQAWRDTAELPARPDQQPPDDPGMVRVSVPEARRLLRLTTTPMTHGAREPGHAWSRWRRRHQARARWHHYQARLRTAQVT